MVADFLAAFKKITLYHNALNKLMKFRTTVTAVKNFVYNTNLFLIFFVGIRMICIYNNSRILEIFLAVQIIETNQILIMVIRDGLSILIATSAEEGM